MNQLITTKKSAEGTKTIKLTCASPALMEGEMFLHDRLALALDEYNAALAELRQRTDYFSRAREVAEAALLRRYKKVVKFLTE